MLTWYQFVDTKFRETIRQALGDIEKSTSCIKFTEVKTTPTGPHIEYIEEENGKGEENCGLSPVGKQTKKNEIQLWCKVNLA